MKYFTAAGDDGTTGLLGNDRVSKDDLRMETIGSLDEANAALGLARAQEPDHGTSAWIRQAQHDLYRILAETAATGENVERFRSVEPADVTRLEDWIAAVGHQVSMPSDFIMPGDTVLSAAYDLARTAVRRAERRAVGLSSVQLLDNPSILAYLNRLSTLCFMLELMEIQRSGADRPSLAKDR